MMWLIVSVSQRLRKKKKSLIEQAARLYIKEGTRMLTSSESPSSCSSHAVALSSNVPSSLMINLKSLTGTGINVHCSGAETRSNVKNQTKE